MNDFFGISMTYIMIGLLAILGIAAASIAWILLRNRIMFLVGVRNIPRRRAQTILIIVGLMLSTVIISAAFSVGDTADYSITNTVYSRLRSVDEIVQIQAADDSGDDDPFEGQTLVTALPMEQDQAFKYAGQFRGMNNVDGAVSVVRGVGAVLNKTKTQQEPRVIIVGVEPSQLQGFEGDFETTHGKRVSLADLGADEIYANQSAADKLDITPGDQLDVSTAGQTHTFTVKEVLKDRVLTGSIGLTQGFVLPLARAQEIFARPGQVDLIAVSNKGGVRDSTKYSDEVTDAINASVAGTRLHASDTKANTVDQASQVASAFVTIFIVLGLFSIAAGMMLIFLIFVMLAAERKVEMGMMRAVGTRRSHLIQSFMSEGMVYNVGAAAVGCAIGVGVGIVMVQVMQRLFAQDNLDITFYVSPRSLVVSYTIGVVLTFLTVTFSSWRTGNLNIVSAIRDLPEPPELKPRPSFRSPLSFIRWFFFKSESFWAFLRRLGLAVLAFLGLPAGIMLFVLAAAIYGAGAAGGVIAVMIAIFAGLLIAVSVVLTLLLLNSIFQSGPLMVVAGIPLMIAGYSGVVSTEALLFGAGFSLVMVGAALCARALGLAARPVFTAMGLLILFFWLLFAGDNVPFLKALNGDFEMFFLSGVTMVLAGTFVLIYNADLMLGLLTLSGGVLTRLVPSIRTAVAYPLANKFRTGMTIAMISLVMFALVMMSTMNENFDRIFLSKNAGGGYDVYASENPGNPIPAIAPALASAGKDPSEIVREDTITVANGSTSTACEVENNLPCKTSGEKTSSSGPSRGEYMTYSIRGLSGGFMQHTTLGFQARAHGFDSDRAVWDAMLSNPDYAIVDPFSVAGGGGFGGDSALINSIEQTDRTFDPIRVDVRDSGTGTVHTVYVIGVISTAGGALYNGLFMTGEAFSRTFIAPESTVHVLQVQQGADSDRVAKNIESTLLSRGVEADSIKKIIADAQAQSRGFLYLIQGFMGIGLFVGIAAVGVVAFRTVVERRQQIGMLRAIGYTRRSIALSFLMESSFTALLGILSGIALGLLLAWQLVKTDALVPGGVDSYFIPWRQIGFIGGLAFVASIVMTIIPSRQASSIPIAEALRYE